MSRFVRSAVVALLLLGGVAPAAAAARPVHVYETAPTLEFAAGEVCDFPVSVEALDADKVTIFAPGPDGTVRIHSSGIGRNRIANLTTGASSTYQGGFSVNIRIEADGSIVFDGSGDLTAFYFPGDNSELGPGLFEVHGHLVERYAPDGSLIAATYSGQARNLCDVVADT